MRLALAQINSTVGDYEGNRAKISDYIERAQKQSADVVIFPELALCGYPPEDLLLKDVFIQDNIKTLNALAKKIKGITAIVGFVDCDKKGNCYNAVAVLEKGRLNGVYHKRELPNYGVFDEKRYFKSGNTDGIFKVNGQPVGISICEDIWVQKSIYAAQAQKGCRLLINISSSPYEIGKLAVRKKLLIERARETKSIIAYVNLVGGQDELVFDGGSMVVNAQGKVIALGKQFEEDLVFVDIDVNQSVIAPPWAEQARNEVTKQSDTKRHPERSEGSFASLRMTSNQTVPLQKAPCLPAGRLAMTPVLSPIEEIYKALVLGTRDYVRKNDFKKVVVGLSGGIDSALVAVIACDAVGRDNVIGVTMPSRFTSNETKSDAKKLAENLKIRCLEIPIEEVAKSYSYALAQTFANAKRDTTEENIQARIRGNYLMALSNKFGWLVLTTGNKSEISVGYCTLYGDMSGGFAVIKDIPKTKVYELARFINNRTYIIENLLPSGERERVRGFYLSSQTPSSLRKAKAFSPKGDKGSIEKILNKTRPLIPESTIDRAPTAELRENQKDQDTLPPYDVLDQILEDYVEKHKSIDDIAKRHPKDLVKRVMQMVDRNEYKRRQAAPGIKITSRAFGKDWRLPLTNKYKGY